MNLPNRISVCRILLIPIFVFFYLATFIPYGKLVALLIFALACFTDFLDGYIARSRGLVTTLGKFLDSIADKILVMSGLILLIAVPIAPHGGTLLEPAIYPTYMGVTFAIIIIGREFMMSALRQIAAAKNVILAADMFGKVKAVFQFVTLIYYFAYAFIVAEFYSLIGTTANMVLSVVGYVLLVATAILTVFSIINYITKNRKIFREEKVKKDEK